MHAAKILLYLKALESTLLAALLCHAIFVGLTDVTNYKCRQYSMSESPSFQVFGFYTDAFPCIMVSSLLMTRFTALDPHDVDLTFYRTFNLCLCLYSALCLGICSGVRMAEVHGFMPIHGHESDSTEDCVVSYTKVNYARVAHYVLEGSAAVVFFIDGIAIVTVTKRFHVVRRRLCDEVLFNVVCQMFFGLGMFLLFLFGKSDVTQQGVVVMLMVVSSMYPLIFFTFFTFLLVHRLVEGYPLLHLVSSVNFMASFWYCFIALSCFLIWNVFRSTVRFVIPVIGFLTLTNAFVIGVVGIMWSLKSSKEVRERPKSSELGTEGTEDQEEHQQEEKERQYEEEEEEEKREHEEQVTSTTNHD